MSIIKLKQTGDTIVEVLICMAISGFALSASFAVARNSQATIRQAEEHGQSLQLAQQQVERFKAWLQINPTKSTDYTSPTYMLLATPGAQGFCILNDTPIAAGQISMQPVNSTDPADPVCAVRQDGVYYCEVNNCTVPPPDTAAGKQTVDNAGFTYRSGIAYPNLAGGNKDEFFSTAGRFAVNGNTSNKLSIDAVVLPYRIHQ
jgi:type II secretory pathway pseudopilin PulG